MAPRWSRTNWVEHALGQLGKRGPEGVTIDALCETAGRTRGSLYHHFGDHDALLSAVLEHWRARYTDVIIDEVEASSTSAREGAARLNDLATAIDFDVEVGIRQLAAGRPWLREAVAAVDTTRIDFLTSLRRRDGSSAKDARALAELEYAAFVGVQHLAPRFSAARLRELYRQLDDRLR